MLNNFRSELNIIAYNIGFNIVVKYKQVILSGNEFSSFANSKIACQ